MKKLVVVGCGASGIVSAIFAKRTGLDVTVLERNSSALKKLLITGNGRCNYFNDDFSIDHFYSSNMDVLDKIITDNNKESILEFFSSIGIVSNIKNGYYYPYSNQASSIKDALLIEAKNLGVKIIYDSYVDSIEKHDNKFIIKGNSFVIDCDKVILASGSCAYPKTGSDGSGYSIVSSLGHKVNEILPSLVPLLGEGVYLKKWEGVRCSASVSLYIDDCFIKKEDGEIQLTSYGISGICVFNISGLANKNIALGKKVFVKINFMPFFETFDDFIKWFDKRENSILNRTIKEHLDCVLNYKLVNAILSYIKIDGNSFWNDLSLKDKKVLAEAIISFKFGITGSKSFDNSQVCVGGVLLNEVNFRTMESLIVPGLYITGELLDVCGDCGGYNLGFAFISGMLAGGSCND